MTPLLRILAVTAALLSSWLLGAGQSSAHAYLVSTDPANGVTLGSAPRAVSIVFSEPVAFAGADSVVVVAEDGTRADTGTVFFSDSTVTVELSPDLPDGVYLSTWRVISTDSHVVAGSVQFGVGVPASPVLQTEESPSATSTIVDSVVKTALYVGIVGSVGVWAAGAAVAGLAGPSRRSRRTRAYATGIVVVASCAQIASQAVDSGQGIAAIAESEFGIVIGIRIVAVSVLLVSVPQVTGWVSSAIVVWSVGRNGHGGAGPWWYSVSTAIHVAAAALWLGGLVCILLCGRRGRFKIRAWSLLALVCAAAVVATGVVQGLSQVQYPAALASTLYGRALIVKSVLVLVLLAAAWWTNRSFRQHARSAGSNSIIGRVRIESTVAVAVLAAAALLSSLAPAKASYRPVEHRVLEAGPYELTADITPARAGSQQIRLRVAPNSTAALSAASLSAQLSSEDNDIGAIDVEFPVRATEPSGPGEVPAVVFHSSAISVPGSGSWTLQVAIVADRLNQFVSSFEYDVI